MTMANPITFNQPFDISTLKDRSVLITGGAAGIGLACATKIAEAGALVTISDLQEEAGRAAAQYLNSQGHRVQFVRCDVTSYVAQVDMFKQAIRFGNGSIDVVIPNAGVIAEKNLFDMIPAGNPTLNGPPPPEPGFVGVAINLQGVYNTCYLALHYFRLPRDDIHSGFKPSIVLVASLAGYVGYPSSSTYSMSKFGVRGLFYGIRDRAMRCSPPVRVNLVAPWYIETAMTRDPEFLASEAGVLLNVMGFAPMDRVVDAVLRFSADGNLYGRAAGIFPASNEDLGDDLEGLFSGNVLQKHMSDVMQKVIKAMAEVEANEFDRQGSTTGSKNATH